MQGHTYRAYERPDTASKHTPLTYENAFHFANVLGVRWQWLMNGEGEPWREPGPLDRLKASLDALPTERQEAVVAAIEALLKTGTQG